MLGPDFRFLFLLKIARSYLQMPETQIAGDKASDFLRRGIKKKKRLNYANESSVSFPARPPLIDTDWGGESILDQRDWWLGRGTSEEQPPPD